MMAAPTQDQLVAQLRLAIPALGTLVSAFGVSTTSVNSYEQMALVSVGPIAYVLTAIWSLIANGKSSIIKSAAGMKETTVTPAGNGKVTITVNDPTLATAAKSVPQTTPPKE